MFINRSHVSTFFRQNVKQNTQHALKNLFYYLFCDPCLSTDSKEIFKKGKKGVGGGGGGKSLGDMSPTHFFSIFFNDALAKGAYNFSKLQKFKYHPQKLVIQF